MLKHLFRYFCKNKKECDHHYIDVLVGESENFGETWAPFCVKCKKYNIWKVSTVKEDPLKWC